MKEVTHQEIYDRLITLEAKVDKLNNETQEVVRAFSAAQGAFTVLEWIATAAKPVLWIAGVVTAFSFMISEYRK
jgi:predicted ATPase